MNILFKLYFISFPIISLYYFDKKLNQLNKISENLYKIDMDVNIKNLEKKYNIKYYEYIPKKYYTVEW